MQVTSLKDVAPRARRVAVGEFDGVHRGHREVISGSDTVLTFEPHPQVVVRPDHAPKLLTSLAVKTELIAGLGARELVVIPFDLDFAAQSPQEFIDSVLVDKLEATHVSVGENFHFGHRASGNAAMLAADSRFETRVVPLVGADGQTISSTQIRALVEAGEVERAADLLAGPFRLQGEVISGDHRGRELGFPTANIAPDKAFVLPAYGVYACNIGPYAAAVSIGVRPTFGDGLQPLVEAYLLDFDGDLYGQTLTLEFLARLRGEVAFESADALVTQIEADVEQTREICGR
jgi:riboflavin kinase / FMN adenylyltransferase